MCELMPTWCGVCGSPWQRSMHLMGMESPCVRVSAAELPSGLCCSSSICIVDGSLNRSWLMGRQFWDMQSLLQHQGVQLCLLPWCERYRGLVNAFHAYAGTRGSTRRKGEQRNALLRASTCRLRRRETA